MLTIVIYVDDNLVTGRNPKKIASFGAALKKIFELEDLGEVKRCLCIDFKRNDARIFLSQEAYTKSMLERFEMKYCNPVSTPMAVGERLTKEDTWSSSDGVKPPYRELIGCLLYLARGMRPDIAHAVSVLSQYNDTFGKSHWSAAKRLLRYLKGTANLGIAYKRGEDPLVGYIDADFAGCIDSRRSFTGYAFSTNGTAVTWESRKQASTATSTTEAEYMALSVAAREAIYFQRFLRELRITGMDSITLHNDNCSAQKTAENPTFHSRTKHIDVR